MRALLVVDVQNDFMPGGALAVPEGDAVVPVANGLMREFDLVVASQDWHPADHKSFASQHPGKKPGDVIDLNGLEQNLWPDHCIQGSHGAKFHPKLETGRIDKIFQKGTDSEIDSYSAFFDNGHRKDTGLNDFLKQKGVTELYLAGVATDFCVKFSAVDAAQLGFPTYLIEEGCRGIDLQPGELQKAIDEMKKAGVKFVHSRDVAPVSSS